MDMNLLIRILSFLLVAAFMLFVVSYFLTANRPQFVISSLALPAARGRMKGTWEDILPWVVGVVVAIGLIFLIWVVFNKDFGTAISDIVYRIRDFIPLT